MKRKASSSKYGEVNIKVSHTRETDIVSRVKGSAANCEFNVSDPTNLPRDAYYYTELHYAAVRGDVIECLKLIKVYPEAVMGVTYHGYLPLDLAAKNGRLEACLLLKANMTTNDTYAIRPYGCTTLELIAKKDDITAYHLKIFEALIGNAPENMHSLATNTKLLHIAILKGHPDLCEIILKKNQDSLTDVSLYGYSALYFAAQTGFEKVIMKLRDSACGQDINDAFLAEKEFNNPQYDNTCKYLNHSNMELLFAVLNDSFTKNTITTTIEQSFSDSCEIPKLEDQLVATCVGENSSLS